MLPWIYGFHWNLGHIIFLGAFYCVLTAVAVTLMRGRAPYAAGADRTSRGRDRLARGFSRFAGA